jgi:UDP-glucuronate 4-epimerase|tara:strand:+ start:379 stop:1362 length:984 start_codon:yes stop_codon:yes gene_type:complete
MYKKIVIVTGVAGFIGFNFCLNLLKKNFIVIGIDSIEGFYDKNLKAQRLKILKKYNNFTFHHKNISKINELIRSADIKLIDSVFHFAAQPGVRLSSQYSDNYLNSNVIAFSKLIHFVAINKIKNFFFASSSSVYGDMTSEQNENKFGNIKSYYALTKVINENIAKNYSNFYTATNFIGLRFFTVYGPFGRPDMAVYGMTNSIYSNHSITLFNKGLNSRDYTYIDDLVEILFSLYRLRKKIKNNYEIFNMGFGKNYKTIEMLNSLESIIGIKAKVKFGINPLDVIKTKSHFKKLNSFINTSGIKISNTPLDLGLLKFINWYKHYHNIK